LPGSLRVVAIIWAVIVTLAVFMMRPPPIQITPPQPIDRLSAAALKLVNGDIEESEVQSQSDG